MTECIKWPSLIPLNQGLKLSCMLYKWILETFSTHACKLITQTTSQWIFKRLHYKLQSKSCQPCTEEWLETVGSTSVVGRTGGYTVITSRLAVSAAMSPASVEATTCTPPVNRARVEVVCTAWLTAGLRPAAVDVVVVRDGRCGYDGTTTAYRNSSSYSS